MKAVEGPDPVDQHVGRRIKQRRKELGMSQEKLGNALGLTFQQIQKYERASNRVSSSKLWHICGVLDVDITYFYDGVEAINESHHADDEELARLNDAFSGISDPALRHAVITLAEQLRTTQLRGVA